jgi:hypothetical protein
MLELDTESALAGDVPEQVFESFLAALAQAELPADLIARLRTNLIEDKDLTERALTAALFPEETQP